MIGVAVIVTVILAVCLRSWQLRRRRRLGYGLQGTWEFRLQQRCRRLLGSRFTHVQSSTSIQPCHCTHCRFPLIDAFGMAFWMASKVLSYLLGANNDSIQLMHAPANLPTPPEQVFLDFVPCGFLPGYYCPNSSCPLLHLMPTLAF